MDVYKMMNGTAPSQRKYCSIKDQNTAKKSSLGNYIVLIQTSYLFTYFVHKILDFMNDFFFTQRQQKAQLTT